MLYVELSHSKTSADFFKDYCGIIQCGGIFTADIYLKIFEDYLLNNFGKHFKYISYMKNYTPHYETTRMCSYSNHMHNDNINGISMHISFYILYVIRS